ncbi:MAG: pyruvate, water dikinase regulatory protein [Oligoflexia bacterium]|nr:pyruvate, water dikinase regulatory protein [Oligoflexia bacterium]
MSNIGGTIFIVSDGTGETASAIVKAALVQYPDRDISLVRCKNIRTEEQLDGIIEEVKARDGAVVFTVVSSKLRQKIENLCQINKIPYKDLFGPLLQMFSKYFQKEETNFTAGLLRQTDEKYFKRIEAIEFTVKHDDGKVVSDLENSDIVLVGISRTSKTPLSIFLSHKGWKVSNVPIVLGVLPPKELFTIDQKKIIALTIDPEKLARIRKNRLEKLGQDLSSDYASERHIHEELEYATQIFSKNRRWPVFDVTEKALEETATEITKLIASRQGITGLENF